ncbi:transposase [uncultured Thiothrix sp.]|uniref:RNA-guided endonuclease InsQ/TnpB family protein n=1 Tax=uncultured Thiothrix sp. TaxID=223185 RepID=UPI0026329A0C|nr:transposase [uncultured Thiothrix sp.]HMT94328.1 transposase [Thiolinea sp.]
MKTLKLRIKDQHRSVLNQLATEVNSVWNYVNDLCFTHLKRTGKFFSAYDVATYTTGASKELNLHSQTIQAVTEELINRRKQFKKAKLNWRVSNKQSARRSLGWIPFKKSALKYSDGFVQYGKQTFKLWDSYGLAQYSVKTGCFVEDTRGRWYVCLVVDNAPKLESKGTESIGIDLGLKDLATLSNGKKLKADRYYRRYEQKLGIAQRARKKHRVKTLHAKIKNTRKNQLHQFSTELVKAYAAIVIGDVSSKALAKTQLAKSVLDAGWGSFKTMLRYKCANAGVWFEEVNEKYTTQACSSCGSLSPNSPKGRAGLGIREWSCPMCGALHDRDVNAAKNILALGHERLAGGILVL